MGPQFLFSPFIYFFLILFSGHQSLVEWLNETLPYLNLPWEASEDELRACLRDGSVLCSLLNQLSPGSMRMVQTSFDFVDLHFSFVLSFWLCVFFPLIHLLLHSRSLAILQEGSFEPAFVKIERFLTAMDEMALPRFEVSDIEQVCYVFMYRILHFISKLWNSNEKVVVGLPPWL